MRLDVGRIDKPHGVQGDVLVTLTTDRLERVDPGSRLHHAGGTLTVVSSRPHQQRFIVTFHEVTNREQAQQMRGVVLQADPIDDPDALWVHDLIGCQVVDLDGAELGVVDAVQDNPASDLLVLNDGGLVPLTFFVEQRDDIIVVDPPAGLLNPADGTDDGGPQG